MTVKRTWTSENNKWSVELVGNFSSNRDDEKDGAYAFLVQDEVNSHKDLVEVVVFATVTKIAAGPKSVSFEFKSSAKLPAYVLTACKDIVWNGRWKGFEAATDLTPAEQDAMASDIIAKYVPAVVPAEEVKPAQEEAAAAAKPADRFVKVRDQSPGFYSGSKIPPRRSGSTVFVTPAFHEKLQQLVAGLEIGQRLDVADDVTVVCAPHTGIVGKTYKVFYKNRAGSPCEFGPFHGSILEHAYEAVMAYEPEGDISDLTRDRVADMDIFKEGPDVQEEEKPLQLTRDQEVEAWAVLVGCIEKWGAMIQAVRAGKVNHKALARFVYQEKVYQHGPTIEADGGPTTRLAQMLNRGQIAGKEFRDLVLVEMTKTVEACKIGAETFQASLGPWLQAKIEANGEAVQQLQDRKEAGLLAQDEYAQAMARVALEYGLSDAEYQLGKTTGVINW